MKVTKKVVDELNIELTVDVAADDYAAIEKKMLNDRRRTAEFKGFRKGMVPATLIKKVYGEQALAESVNQVVTDALDGFIKDEKLNLLGEPLPSKNQKEQEWNDGNDFSFVFDAALYPEVKVEADKSDEIPAYNVTVSAADKKNMVESLKNYYESIKKQAQENAEKEGAEKVEIPADKTAEELEKEATDRLTEQYTQQAEWRKNKDIRDYFVKKSGIKLPEEFLKRWLLAANAGKVKEEDVEKEFGGFAEDFKWQVVRGNFIKAYDIKVEKADIEQEAANYVKYQYAMYGMNNLPDTIINDAVKNMLDNSEQINRLAEQVEDRKVTDKLKEVVTFKPKKITSEKFREL